jgi:hypothetical protein
LPQATTPGTEVTEKRKKREKKLFEWVNFEVKKGLDMT